MGSDVLKQIRAISETLPLRKAAFSFILAGITQDGQAKGTVFDMAELE